MIFIWNDISAKVDNSHFGIPGLALNNTGYELGKILYYWTAPGVTQAIPLQKYLKSYWKTVRANTSGWLENKGLEVQCASGSY